MRLSIVIPVYNEAGTLPRVVPAVTAATADIGMDCEILFVDDGSRDDSWNIITQLCEQYPMARGLRLSRNFGKEGAMRAGLEQASGDCVVIMDGDLQFPPDKLPEMVRLWREGYQVVECVKSKRQKESLSYGLFAKVFYGLLHRLGGINLRDATDFRLMDRAVVTAVLAMPERQLFYRAMSTWVGFSRIQIFIDIADRADGKSRFSKRALINLATNAILGYSSLPLQIMTVCGVVFWVFGFVLGVQTLWKYFFGEAATGFTTVILLILITGSLLMLGLGIIGAYLARIYEEVKHRPTHLVSQIAPKDSADVDAD